MRDTDSAAPAQANAANTIHHRDATVIVKFEAADRSGMTLDELDLFVRRARAIELPGDAKVYAPSTAISNQVVRKLEIR